MNGKRFDFNGWTRKDIYRDGGTEVWQNNKTNEIVFVDYRIGSNTEGSIFSGYPSSTGAMKTTMQGKGGY